MLREPLGDLMVLARPAIVIAVINKTNLAADDGLVGQLTVRAGLIPYVLAPPWQQLRPPWASVDGLKFAVASIDPH
jgi:hypothetical protein